MIPTSSAVSSTASGIYKHLHIELAIFHTFNHHPKAFYKLLFLLTLTGSNKTSKLSQLSWATEQVSDGLNVFSYPKLFHLPQYHTAIKG